MAQDIAHTLLPAKLNGTFPVIYLANHGVWPSLKEVLIKNVARLIPSCLSRSVL